MRPWILLITLSLSSCGSWVPVTRPKQINQRENLCNQYKLNYGKTLTMSFEKTIPLEECLVDGNFVITRDELFELRRKYNEMSECYRKSCQNKKGKKQ